MKVLQKQARYESSAEADEVRIVLQKQEGRSFCSVRCEDGMNKRFLYCTEFFAGMSVMAVELGASRLLAPYFSSSQIVWTIIIGTIMAAMALGNLYGGRAADRENDPDRLYRRILIAAVWIGAIPAVGKYVVIALGGLVVFVASGSYLILAAFASCLVLFVFPLFLLGTVTPSLAKHAVSRLDESGSTVGRLNAANTIGSIIGTFVPTFVSIPTVGTSATFLIFAGILLVIAGIYEVLYRKKVRRIIAGILLFLLSAVLGHNSHFAFWTEALAYEGESIYNYLQVYETEKEVVLSTNTLFGVQSVYRKDENLSGMYYDYVLGAPYMTGLKDNEDLDVLILGMGTGTFAGQCLRYFDNVTVEGVEIDGKISDLARTYFFLPEEAKVSTQDGRAFLEMTDRIYDVILVDAYQDITIPFQMSSEEFFCLVKSHLAPDGVMAVNMNMKSDAPDGINAYLADTIASVFPEVYLFDVRGYTNRLLFASADGGIMDRFTDKVKVEAREELYTLLNVLKEGLIRYQNTGLLLTDDKAPVELLGAKAIDEVIREEVSWYKEIFRQEGITGLLDRIL